jgi:hypothetical protein
MMQVASHQIIDVITVRHGFMTAIWPVNMIGSVPRAMMRSTTVRIGRSHRQNMFLDTSCRGMMQMAIMQIIDMIAMLYGGMPTVRSVLMLVLRVNVGHLISLLCWIIR